jgi:hypothetical protein
MTARATPPLRIAWYLRHGASLHYFAAFAPYLEHFARQGVHHNRIVVREPLGDLERIRDYREHASLFDVAGDLDGYDLVITPTHLRDHEIASRAHVVQIFHGMSDKPFTYERDFSGYRLCLCAGARQRDRLLRNPANRRARIEPVGYPKFDRVAAAPPPFDNARPTVVYAPTWRKAGLSSIDILLGNRHAIDAITADYNLIVKPHPNLFDAARPGYESRTVAALQALAGETGSIRLVRAGNVMPWFAHADLFVGDISASCYEWLYFDRPMVFLNPQPGALRASDEPDSPTLLWRCGDVCDDAAALKAAIDRALRHDRHREAREAALRYSVVDPRGGSATRRGIERIEAVIAELTEAKGVRCAAP